MRNSDALAFFLAWAANPLQVASVIPSGDALADLITSEISPATGPVIELGPGTGAFTRALIARGVDEHDLTLVEYGRSFARLLELRFPEARVLNIGAERLALAPQLFDGDPAGAVVSGLPLLSMSTKSVMSILRGSFAHLRESGRFYQFTYGPVCPVSRQILDRLGLTATRIGGTVCNFPPASVYRIARRTPAITLGSAAPHTLPRH